MDFLKPKMDALTYERFNEPIKTIQYIYTYKAVCSEGFAIRPITLIEADFIIARKITFHDKKPKETYYKKINELAKLELGKQFVINEKPHYYSVLTVIPKFQIENKEFKL